MVVRARPFHVFLRLAGLTLPRAQLEDRWQEFLQIEADVIRAQAPGLHGSTAACRSDASLLEGRPARCERFVGCRMFFHMDAARFQSEHQSSFAPRRSIFIPARMNGAIRAHPQTSNARRRRGRNHETVQAKKFRGINDSITAHIGDQTSRFLLHPECEFLSDTIGANTLPQA